MRQKRQKTLLSLFMAAVTMSTALTWWINTQVNLSSGEQSEEKKGAMSIFFDSTKKHTATEPTSFTVDILSVGSTQQLDLLKAQQRTMGTHISIRNFFNVTEVDDADPTCSQDLTYEQIKQVSDFCRRKKGSRGWKEKLSPIHSYMKRNYAQAYWLKKKKSPSGWLCAQSRPYAGLMKVWLHYRDTGEALPNYFLILDDDTYYNMELFQKNFEVLDSSHNLYYAGCLVRSSISEGVEFTFPFGGFGSILSKGVLRNLFQRIDCPKKTYDTMVVKNDIVGSNNSTKNEEELHTNPICNRLEEDNVGERKYFRSGMNFVELMYKFTNTERYRNVAHWTSGFCMHSDWVIGYFFNYYNISKHVKDPIYKNVPHARLESYHNSELTSNEKTGYCKQEGKSCSNGTAVCHRATPAWMEEETDRWIEEEVYRLSSATTLFSSSIWWYKLIWVTTTSLLGLILSQG